MDGKHVIASPTHHPDLFWALSGGGAGNYAVILSLTTKAHADGPIAGGTLTFQNTNDDAFWAGVSAWLKHQVVLDAVPGFSSLWGMTKDVFRITYITLPGGKEADINTAMSPFLKELQAANITPTYATGESAGFYEHFQRWQTDLYITNSSQGSWLIPASAVQNKSLPKLVKVFRDVVNDLTVFGEIAGVSNNFSYQRVGSKPGANSVLPAWRNAIFTVNLVAAFEASAPNTELARIQGLVNQWQNKLRDVAPNSGGYINEATFDDTTWKGDYFGKNYNRLLAIKRKYDPEYTLWSNAAVGSDEYWTMRNDGRLCRKH
ncbi:hypothetical protein O1611_g9947 [Lasiodiplodia mahajangana]|uniref:Uncharacterized protein n=1 Tax=Lasiodiplodia mahajangana TaxID=1108764 RepID=A0ACC2J3P8_9PEZI|nr:hypothetical protein O1611_g9947 [Lasiodiplodia mahajangana]